MFEHKGEALIIEHFASGREETFSVDGVRVEVRHHADYIRYPITARVWFEQREKSKRRKPQDDFLWIKTDNNSYVTIEVAGEVAYDSRRDVPYDPPPEKKNPPAEKKKRLSRAQKATEVAGCNQDAVEAAAAE